MSDVSSAAVIVSSGKLPISLPRLDTFDREARLLSQLRHPCICSFFGTCRHDGAAGFVLELLPRSLFQLVHAADESLPFMVRRQLAHETALGLTYLHHNGILRARGTRSTSLT